MRKINIFGYEETSKEEVKIINEALYYAVRENLNQKIDEFNTKKLKEALEIMKNMQYKPGTSMMCNRSFDDFLTSCVTRGWEEDLKEIEWLEVVK